MMNQTGFPKKAQWIGAVGCPAPVIRRRFTLSAEDIPAAELFITGLGYFEASVNGCPVSADRFQPVISDYEKRTFVKINYPCRDTFTHRIYYCRYPVSALLREGENELEIRLGGGWYNQTERIAEGEMAYGSILKAIYELRRGEDILLASDGSEVWHAGDIVFSNLFIGEIHDRTAPAAAEQPVVILPAPQSEMTEQIGTPDCVIRTIRPIVIGTVDGRVIYDAGENISGVVRITQSGADAKSTLRFAEELHDDGSLDFTSTGENYLCTSGVHQIMTDTFIGEGVFEPRFVWHAFRYFDVEGEIDCAEVLVIHSDTPVTSTFDSSAEGLNFLYEAYLRAQLDNMHGSIPSDCPHRERLGYTGDGQNCAEAAMMLLDSREFYRKWIRDILDCQDPDTGHIQHTAPFQGGGGGPGGWGCAVIIVPYVYYRHFGDTDILHTCYAPMRRWIDYLTAHSENHLIVREEDGGWCLGDWCTLEKCEIPEPFVNSYFLVRCLRMLCEIAAVTGHGDDIAAYRQLDDAVCASLRDTYFDGSHFCGGIQGADAYAIDIGIAPEGSADRLAAECDARGHFDTGFLGTDVLLRVLFETDHADTALRLLESEELGSFLYMKRHGATTIWENWNGASSHNHPMFGGCARYLHQYLLGIGQRGAGWQEIVIAPKLPQTLEHISGSIVTVRGEISVAAARIGEHLLRLTVSLPADTDAELEWMGETHHLQGGVTALVLHA